MASLSLAFEIYKLIAMILNFQSIGYSEVLASDVINQLKDK